MTSSFCSLSENALGLYVHIPFCLKKCFFCSFAICVSQINRSDEYLDCLEKEVKKHSPRKISTIYVGGGTPTLLASDQLVRLMQIIWHHFFVAERCEFTVETNPDTISDDKAKILKSFGVNRISIGAQTSFDQYLKFLGRTHQHQQTKACVDLLRRNGFENISIDFMYGFPGQTRAEIKKDLKELLGLSSEHVSLYSLTIEENSKFYRYRKDYGWPCAETMADFYTSVSELMREKSFQQYEISNFAQPQKESRHNCIYWQGGNYLGIGMAAYSHIDGHRFGNVKQLLPYLKRVRQNLSPVEEEEFLLPAERLTESLIFGLRMNKGVFLSKIEERLETALRPSQKEQIKDFIQNGFLVLEQGSLRATSKGRLILDELSARLI